MISFYLVLPIFGMLFSGCAQEHGLRTTAKGQWDVGIFTQRLR